MSWASSGSGPAVADTVGTGEGAVAEEDEDDDDDTALVASLPAAFSDAESRLWAGALSCVVVAVPGGVGARLALLAAAGSPPRTRLLSWRAEEHLLRGAEGSSCGGSSFCPDASSESPFSWGLRMGILGEEGGGLAENCLSDPPDPPMNFFRDSSWFTAFRIIRFRDSTLLLEGGGGGGAGGGAGDAGRGALAGPTVGELGMAMDRGVKNSSDDDDDLPLLGIAAPGAASSLEMISTSLTPASPAASASLPLGAALLPLTGCGRWNDASPGAGTSPVDTSSRPGVRPSRPLPAERAALGGRDPKPSRPALSGRGRDDSATAGDAMAELWGDPSRRLGPDKLASGDLSAAEGVVRSVGTLGPPG